MNFPSCWSLAETAAASRLRQARLQYWHAAGMRHQSCWEQHGLCLHGRALQMMPALLSLLLLKLSEGEVRMLGGWGPAGWHAFVAATARQSARDPQTPPELPLACGTNMVVDHLLWKKPCACCSAGCMEAPLTLGQCQYSRSTGPKQLMVCAPAVMACLLPHIKGCLSHYFETQKDQQACCNRLAAPLLGALCLTLLGGAASSRPSER